MQRSLSTCCVFCVSFCTCSTVIFRLNCLTLFLLQISPVKRIPKACESKNTAFVQKWTWFEVFNCYNHLLCHRRARNFYVVVVVIFAASVIPWFALGNTRRMRLLWMLTGRHCLRVSKNSWLNYIWQHCSRKVSFLLLSSSVSFSIFTGQMLFLAPNQQCQSTEGSNNCH